MKNKKIKVFYDYQIACSQKYGGVSRYHYELMRNLNKGEDIKTDMYALFSKNYYFENIFRRKAVSNYIVSQRTISRLNKLATILHLKSHRYDIIHPTWYEDYFPQNINSKFVITIHDMTQEQCMEGKELIIQLKKNYIYKADHIIAISENTRNDILALYPDVPPEKISVVYHGTNHLPKPVEPDSWRCPEKYILFVGSRNNYKNGMLLVKELHDFVISEDIQIIYAGGGEFSDKEEALINRYGLRNRVAQHNVTDAELAYLYQHAICFIYPSSYEGFGFPLLEAFDNSCPVICSNASCFPEIASDAAMYFELDYNGSLKEAISKLCSDSYYRNGLIAKGKERVKAFSWAQTARDTMEVYRKVLEG